MEFNVDLFVSLFFHTLGYWRVIIPSILLGLIVGAIPGFSAAITIIILLPLTLIMNEEVGLIFIAALYCSARMGAGIPEILVNTSGTAGAADGQSAGLARRRQSEEKTVANARRCRFPKTTRRSNPQE